MRATAGTRLPIRRSVARRAACADAFSLLELVVVVAIIGLMATISLPALKSARKSNTMVSAGRQLVDDLALARAKAIGERTVVHVVFIPSEIGRETFDTNTKQGQMGERLKTKLYSTYALFAERTVGDQPGRAQLRYLTSWRSLPDGVFIATNKLWDDQGLRDTRAVTNRPMEYRRSLEQDTYAFPFPTVDSLLKVEWPRITFDTHGQLVNFRAGNRVFENEVIPLARGSIFISRDANGLILEPPDVRESPPDNSVENYHRVVIDGLTGRARVETRPITP